MFKMLEFSLAFSMPIISNENKDLDLFSNLPPETIIEILSRLPFRSIFKSKLVHVPWRQLIESREFARVHHLSKPDPHPYLITSYHFDPDYKILELNDGLKKIVSFTLPYKEPLHSSVNGLILLGKFNFSKHLLVCNPITREYARLPENPRRYYSIRYWGFGVSTTSKQYKLVLISQWECQVYTLGTGQWRSMALGPAPDYQVWDAECASVGGSLHWLDHGTLTEEGVPCSISCFDLETEGLTYFSAPPPPRLGDDSRHWRSLSVLEDCLCVCDVVPNAKGGGGDQIEVWLRRGQSWRKEFVMRDGNRALNDDVFPVKVLEDGGILLREKGSTDILHYSSSSKKKKKKKSKSGGWCRRLYPNNHHISETIFDTAAVFTPNFIPLKTMEKEDVRTF